MDRLVSLVILLLVSSTSWAASTTVQPIWGGLTKTTVGTVPTFAANAGTPANGIWTFSPGPTSFPGMATDMKNSISTAVTLRAPVTQSLAKTVALGAIRATPGILLTGLALELGLEYAQGQWNKSTVVSYSACTAVKCATGTTLYNAVANVTNNPGGFSNGVIVTATVDAQNQTKWCLGTSSNLCAYGSGAYSTGQTTLTPATQTVWDSAATQLSGGRNLTDAELQQMIAAGYAVPIGNLQTQVNPSPLAVPLGDPVTDPVTGQRTRPMAQVDPAPDGAIRMTPYEAPVDAAGNPATNAQGQPLPNQTSNVDPCTLNPDRAGCVALGSPDGEKAPTDTTVTVNMTATPWGGEGMCPAPHTISLLGQGIEFSYQPVCNFFSAMKPVVLAAAFIVSTLILIGGVKGGA